MARITGGHYFLIITNAARRMIDQQSVLSGLSQSSVSVPACDPWSDGSTEAGLTSCHHRISLPCGAGK